MQPKIKHAKYRRNESNLRYRGNALITSLPEVPSRKEAFMGLANFPEPRFERFREAAYHRRLESLHDLDQVFLPDDRHIDALQTILSVVRHCYSMRDPRDPKVMRAIHSRTQRRPELLLNVGTEWGGSYGLTLRGVTGSGKTTFLRRLQKFLPMEPQYHRKLGGQPCLWPQLPMVWTQCAAQGTLKTVLKKTIEVIDAVSGTAYGEQIRADDTRAGNLNKLERVCSVLMVGLLALDDIQNPKEASHETEVLRNHLCGFMDSLAMPLMIVANHRAKGFLGEDIQHQSKLSSAGCFDFPPMEFDGNWNTLMRKYWDLHIFSTDTPMPADFPKLLFMHSQGVRRFAQRLAKEVLKEGARNENVAVNEALINRVSAQVLAPYKAALDVLRRYRLRDEQLSMEELKRFDELLPVDPPSHSNHGDEPNGLRSDDVAAGQPSAAAAAQSPLSESAKVGSTRRKKAGGLNRGDGKLLDTLTQQGLVQRSLDDDSSS